MKDGGQFLESNKYGRNFYGTSVEAFEAVQAKGQICLLEIDINGAKKVKGKYEDAKFVFIMPPGEGKRMYDELENRIRGRANTTNVDERVQQGRTEIELCLALEKQKKEEGLNRFST